MNFQQRSTGKRAACSSLQALVAQIASATARFGTTVEETPSGFVHFRAPSEMCLMLNLTDGEIRSERFLLNWYVAADSQKELDHTRFPGAINPHHLGKATGGAHGVEDLLEQVQAGFASAQSGDAFRPNPQEKRTVKEKIDGMDLLRVNGIRYEWNETFSAYWSVAREPRTLMHVDLIGAKIENGRV